MAINWIDRSTPKHPFFCIVDNKGGNDGPLDVSYALPAPRIIDNWLLHSGNLPYDRLTHRRRSEEKAAELLQGLERHGAWTVKTEERLNARPLETAYFLFLAVNDKERTIRLSRETDENRDFVHFIQASVIGRIKIQLLGPDSAPRAASRHLTSLTLFPSDA